MKVYAVNLTLFRSQNTQQDGKLVNPYLYTVDPKKSKDIKPSNLNIFLGTLATLAVGVTLYKIFGRKIL